MPAPQAWLASALALGLVAAAAVPAFAVPECGIPLTHEQQARIDRGEVVARTRDTTKSTLKDVLAIGYVNAAPDAVWHVLSNYERYPAIFPDVVKSEVRKRTSTGVRQFAEVKYPWPLANRWTLNEVVHEPGHRVVRFHRLEGTIKELVGSWHLYPDGNKTLLVYALRLDPGLPFVPHWVIEWGATHELPAIIGDIRTAVKAGY